MTLENPKQISDSIDTIVLPVRGKDDERLDSLVGAVLEVGVPAEAKVVVTHVFSKDRYHQIRDQLGYDDNGTVDEIAQRQATVTDVCQELNDEGLETRVKGIIDESGDGIVQIANSADADRVIVSGRRRTPTGKAVFGSTAQQVLLDAPCPVTFVRAE